MLRFSLARFLLRLVYMRWQRFIGMTCYTLVVIPLCVSVFEWTMQEAGRRTCLPMLTVYGGPFIIVAASFGMQMSRLMGGRAGVLFRWGHLICLGLGLGLVLFARP